MHTSIPSPTDGRPDAMSTAPHFLTRHFFFLIVPSLLAFGARFIVGLNIANYASSHQENCDFKELLLVSTQTRHSAEYI